MYTLYLWDNGAMITSLDPEFEDYYQELVMQFGEPDHVIEHKLKG